SLNCPLIDGQGNFGHIDGDSPAAMRYTEARSARIAEEMLHDINKDTVDFTFNFDDSLQEPTVLPARIPNLLINGSSGIAVGMATNMLPHNLREVIEGIIATIDDPEIEIEELIKYVKAPDLPTGGIIYGLSGVHEAYHTGRGRVVVRGKADIRSKDNSRDQIIITEIPYQVNKSSLIVKMADLVQAGRIDGISDIRDESDRRTGIRIVVDLKRDAIGKVVLSQLFKYTPLQSSYGVNNIALVNNRPKTLNLKDLIVEFIKFRLEVIVRRTQYDLNKAEERAHILEGLLIALDHIDEVIELIRGSKTVDEASTGLMQKFSLTEIQAKAILDMRLQRLVGLERDKVKEEYEAIKRTIAHYRAILASEQMRRDIIKEELTEIRERYGDDRRTEITFAEGDISIEDMIPDEEVVITISHLGYIKRTKVDEYRIQGRGGRGSRGSKTRDADFIEHMFIANNHNYLLLFTELGRCHWLRAYEIPEASKTSSGRVIQNIIQLPKDDKVRAYIIIQDLRAEEFINNNYIVFATKKGMIKKTIVEAFSRPRVNGINAITIKEGDSLIEAKLTDGSSEILLANRNGRAIRFPEQKVRPMGRSAAGVRGIRIDDDGQDEVIGMVCVDPNEQISILVVSEKGNGKRSALDDYRITNRGGKGVKTLQITEKTGPLVTIKAVTDTDNLIITNRSGIVIRMAMDDIRIMGRATQGVKVISLSDDDEIADVAVIYEAENQDEEE
ncbi:MAG: DNA gyrase subunit A, partial [Saprospiraceae bacterium]|nr:DNA gyrase subunit A [Saprospiraceae bacterium]